MPRGRGVSRQVSQESSTGQPGLQMPNNMTKLKGQENWTTWKMLMLLFLQRQRLDSYLTTPTSAEDLADPESEGHEMDGHVRCCIAFNLEAPVLKILTGCSERAYDMWTALCASFENQGVQRRLTLLYKFLDTKRCNFKSLNDYVVQVRETFEQLSSSTADSFLDEMGAAVVLRNLRTEDDLIKRFAEQSCTKVNASGDQILSFNLVVQRLFQEAQKELAESASTALFANQDQRPGFASRGGRGGRGPARRGRGGRGGYGGRGGFNHGNLQDGNQHQSNYGYSTKVYPPCRWCSRTNHPEENCFYKQGLKRKEDYQRKWDTPNESRGHKRGMGKNSQRSSSSHGPNNWALKTTPTEQQVGSAKMAKRSAASALLNMVCKSSLMTSIIRFFIDSGASDHMCGCMSCLSDYVTTLFKQPIECAGTQILHIEGLGRLTINSARHNGLTEISNVKHVPGLTSNLLSVSQMAKSGYAVVFIESKCGIFNAKDITTLGEPLLEATESNGTYQVDLEVKIQHAALQTSVVVTEPWHERFGHLGKNNMSIVPKLVDGMTKVTVSDQKCSTCQRAKTTKGSFPKGGARRASEILGLVHSDVCEITDGLSIQGFRYFVTFIDDLTRYTYIALLKLKSSVFEKFKEYKSLVERHTGKRIKCLRSDNGGEYVNDQFKQYFAKEGILHQFSVAGNPEQNGVSERTNRTVIDKTRALLKGAGLSNKYWHLALHTAVFLKNISPTKAVKDMTPYEAWTGSKPDVSILRVFGCVAHAFIETGKKLTDKTKDFIFVGYDEERKAYKLMDMVTNAVSSHRYKNVTFTETRFPALEQTQVERSQKLPEVAPEASVSVVRPVVTRTTAVIPETSVSVVTPEASVSAVKPVVTRTTAVVQESDNESDYSDSEIDEETKTQKKGDSLWGYYSDTSLSGMFHDGSSTSGSETSVPIDVETISDNDLNIRTNESVSRKRCSIIPKHFDGFVLYGFGGAKAASVSNDSCKRRAWFASQAISEVPCTVEEALKTPESQLWLEAMRDELDSFEQNKVWTLQSPQAGAPIVGNKWVFKRKTNIDGSTLYRARLVAKGYTQKYGVDYFDTYAPVVRRESLRILFSVAVNFNLKISHLDVKTAFLHGDLTERVYMAQPDGFEITGSEQLVCRLHKAVYGLKQAARSWNLKADHLLKQEGFVNTPQEPCIYIRVTNAVTIIALYVDDFYLFYRNDQEKSKLLEALNGVVQVKDLGEAKNCLGMRIERDWSKGTLKLHQEEYTRSILSRFRMESCDGKSVPMECKLRLYDHEMGHEIQAPYQHLIGSLLYLSTNTRPDISYAVSFLSQFNSCYTSTHWDLAKRVLNYLKQTIDFGLNYKKCNQPSFSLTGYSDADWAGNPADYKSYTGFCFTLDDNLICWESRKQKCSAQSTTESESIALAEAVKESIYLNNLIDKLFDKGLQRVKILCDNQATLKLAESENYFKARSKHFGCRIQLLRDCIQEKLVSLSHVPSAENHADIFTKALERVNHERCVNYLRLKLPVN